MGSFKMIVYPFGLAIAVLAAVTLAGMAVFGIEAAAWDEWQNELVGTVGTAAGLAAAVVGLWLAIRSEGRTFW